MLRCAGCGQEKYLLSKDQLCETCEERKLAKELAARLNAIVLTTGLDVPNRKIEKILGIVASETALGLNIFKDIPNNWRDFLGGRSHASQASLKEARTACLTELRQEAHRLGADAVIAVDLDYNELSTSGAGILFVAATGTAVKLIEEQ